MSATPEGGGSGRGEAEPITGERALRREIGLVAATAIVVNATIGTGIFRTPAQVLRDAGTMEAALAVWVAGAVIALAGALSIAELAASMPRAGGLYEFLRRLYGPRIAFVYGWTKVILLAPSSVGSFALLSADALLSLTGADAAFARPVALGVVLVLGTLTLGGVRASAVQQTVITVMKITGVLALGLFGLALPFDVAPPEAPTAAFALAPSALGMASALVAAMWAYDGWADLAALGGETRAPGRTLPRALLLGTLVVAGLYLLVNLAYARVLGEGGLRASGSGSAMAAMRLADLTLGEAGRRALSGLVLVSTVGGCMASLLTSSRAFVPMATDGVFFRALGAVEPRRGVPRLAVVSTSLLGCAYVLSSSFESLTDAFVVGYFPFYALAIVALMVLRRREPDLARPFRVPLYPLPPLVFLLGAACVLGGAIGDLSVSSAAAFAIMLSGLPASWLYERWGR